MHWATIWVRSGELGTYRAEENTPDFMLEQFIVLLLDGTCVAPHTEKLESTAMAIQHNYTQS